MCIYEASLIAILQSKTQLLKNYLIAVLVLNVCHFKKFFLKYGGKLIHLRKENTHNDAHNLTTTWPLQRRSMPLKNNFLKKTACSQKKVFIDL